MKTPVILLLTSDPNVEDTVAEIVHEVGAVSHLTVNAADAFEIISGTGGDLDLAVIDCEHGPYGISLVNAISSRHEQLPVIVLTGDGGKYIEALAYANGASDCLSKPVSVEQLATAVKHHIPAEDALASRS